MITLTDVRKSFGNVPAVNGLSLSVRKGEVLGLLGPNGAGKSTTIAMIVGVLKPDGGRVTLNHDGKEHDPNDQRARSLIGLAPQSLALYDELSALENLSFFGSLYGLTGRVLRERCDVALERVGLSDRRDHRSGTFSGGMKRRLNLAAAILHDPELVLMDEPTAGVDPQSRNAIFEIVEGLKSKGKTIVYSTHYMEEAQRLCDRVAIIDRGTLLALDTVPTLVKAHGGHSTVRVLHAGNAHEQITQTDRPLEVLSAALSTGNVQSATIDSPDLERVFLNLTGRSLRD
ncbi:MAG: ABC transporter ATP-binding protein [Phycisphaerales bacterium]|nr:ABC transporter ATP-binding protein [Phycisphaerales bacterium]